MNTRITQIDQDFAKAKTKTPALEETFRELENLKNKKMQAIMPKYSRFNKKIVLTVKRKNQSLGR